MQDRVDRSTGKPDPGVRVTAAACASVVWCGLALQWAATIAYTDDALLAALALLRYFTILTNLAAAAGLTAVALGRWPPAAWNAGVVLCMATVAAVYALLLEGFLVLPGLGPLANIFIHRVSPAVLTLFWLACAPKGGLRLRDPFAWLAVLATYAVYALGRGALEGEAIYPFLDFAKLGWSMVALVNLAIGLLFLVAGIALVRLDRRLAERGSAGG